MESISLLESFRFKNRRSLQPRVLCSSRNKDYTCKTTRMLSKRGICLCFIVLGPVGRTCRWRRNGIDRNWRKIITTKIHQQIQVERSRSSTRRMEVEAAWPKRVTTWGDGDENCLMAWEEGTWSGALKNILLGGEATILVCSNQDIADKILPSTITL